MANIVASAITSNVPQKDGRLAITEQHTDVLGIAHYAYYLAAAGTSYATLLATMNARAVQLGLDLQNGEIATNVQNALNAQIYPTFNYSTTAQGSAALRAFYLTASAWDATRMGNFIFGLNLSDVSLENLFGVAAGAPLAALKANLAAANSAYTSAMAQRGQ